MPRKPKQAPILCDHFEWHLRRRDGVYYADGRGGQYDLGKHSLGTRDRDEALVSLRQLDLAKAIELGLVEESEKSSMGPIGIVEGWERYLEYCGRNSIMGGVAPGSLKRYQNIRDRHIPFCKKHGIETWNKFDRKMLERYGNQIFRKFAYRTCYVDLTQLKAAVNWLITEELLSPECKLVYPLRKPEGSDTYCYTHAEFTAMVRYCQSKPDLEWLSHVMIGLGHLGLRIGELTGLRWSDIDLDANMVRIADERSSKKRAKAGTARTTKGRRSRMIPIHPELKKTLLQMKRKADGRVFHAARGGVLRENNALKILKEQVIRPLSERFPTPEGEIGFECGTFHSFRHFFCSQCFLGGASEGEIREWMGHRESKIVELYRHLHSEDAQRKMKQISFLGSDDEEDCNSNVA